jgi:hypothetical protein
MHGGLPKHSPRTGAVAPTDSILARERNRYEETHLLERYGDGLNISPETEGEDTVELWWLPLLTQLKHRSN